VRYAVLFSGMSFRRHVNGLEFCYRALVDHLGFVPGNIHVLNYDGSLRAFGDPQGGPEPPWPGDGSPFRMVVRAAGSRAAFQQTIATLAAQLTPDDQLFINTVGHGGHHGDERGPDLITYPYSKRFSRDDFCATLASLPPHRSLVVLMAQCFSGGFNNAVLQASPAASTFITSAASETGQSFMTPQDGHWDSFQVNWLSGLMNRLSVGEAFRYACTCAARNPYDSPEFAARPQHSSELQL
jgi:hypothetical protein